MRILSWNFFLERIIIRPAIDLTASHCPCRNIPSQDVNSIELWGSSNNRIPLAGETRVARECGLGMEMPMGFDIMTIGMSENGIMGI